jgi:hypothetical protein
MIKFPSIGQYRDAIREVGGRATYAGRDENGYPIYDGSATLPTLEYVGTVKLHGTNSSVVIGPDDNITTQSRKRVITPEKDNAGFSRFIFEEVGEDYWKRQAEVIRGSYDLSADDTIVVYGEWCGGSIQKTVALAQLPKMMVVFAIRIGTEEDTRWISPQNLIIHHPKVNNIFNYPNHKLEIDFENPGEIRNTLVEITEGVEKRCPVAFAHGVDGLGEGMVWRCVTPGYEESKFWFKVKGEKHSVTKVKTLAPINPEKMKSLKEFVDATVTEQRLRQGIEHLLEMGHVVSKRNTGEFLSWVFADINKEEADTLEASSLTSKDIGKPVSLKARRWFFKYLQEEGI